MADWGNYVIQGGLTKVAPNMANDPNWKILAYFIFPPKANSYHVVEPPDASLQLGLVSDTVILPGNYKGFSWEKPNDEFPVGDWSIGSKVYRLYKDDTTGVTYKVTFSLVSWKSLFSAGRNPIGKGFISLVLASFNYVTFNLFQANMGGWLITSITESGGSSTYGNISDKFGRGSSPQVANKKKEQSKSSAQMLTWLGYGLVGYGVARKNTTVAIGGGLVLAYTRAQKVKALEAEFDDKIESLVPSIFQ